MRLINNIPRLETSYDGRVMYVTPLRPGKMSMILEKKDGSHASKVLDYTDFLSFLNENRKKMDDTGWDVVLNSFIVQYQTWCQSYD